MTRRKTHEEFIKQVYDQVGNEYEVLGTYINANTKIEMLHSSCKTKYNVKPNNFLIGQRCPTCYGNIRKTDECFKREVFELVGNEYEVLDEYINGKTKLAFKHKLCNNIWRTIPEAFINGNRCPYCSHSIQKDTAMFKKDVYNLVGEEYMVLGEYVKNKIKILLKHQMCGSEWLVAPNNFLQGQRCPKCKMSKGERKIKKYFDDNNIRYIHQFGFKELKGFGGKTLRFDFAIIYEDNIMLLLEYDGRQHFEPVDFSGKGEIWAINQFKEVKEKDILKNLYCKENDIQLLRIPYWKFDEIEIILNKLIHNEK